MWDVKDAQDVLEVNYSTRAKWERQNLKVFYTLQTPCEAIIFTVSTIKLGLNLYLDLFYALIVPKASVKIGVLMWFTIIIPNIPFIVAMLTCKFQTAANELFEFESLIRFVD